jgi:hypothetical protein
MDDGHSPFDNVFENIRRDVDPAKLRSAARWGFFLLVVLLVCVVGFSSLVPATEYLWFLHDARHPEVFAKSYVVRSMLFTIAFLASWAVLYGNIRLAFNLTMVFLEAPTSRGQVLVTNAIALVQSKGATVVRLGAPVLAFFSALGFSNEWSTYLLASHSQAFGVKDPTYGLDLGFFVFSLPWYRAISNYVCAELLLATLCTVGVYAGLQAMAALAKIELGRPRVRVHIHVLVGVTVLAYAAQVWLKTYEAGLIGGGQFTGAGYAAMQGLAVQRFVAVLGIIVGLGCIVNGWTWRPYAVVVRGIAATVVVYVLGVLVWPPFVEQVWVGPARIQRESPYADKAIAMTRLGYGLDGIQVRTESPSTAPTAQEVATSQSTFDNMRLWDPDVLRQCLEGFQAIRPYYRFYDVDIDRYMVGGKKTLLMLSPRQLDLSGLQPNARNWANEKLQYTHGYGLVVTQVDQETSDGEPVMLDLDVPQRSTSDLAIAEPRLYFGDNHDPDHPATDDYAIVDTGQAEFDYPTSDSGVTTRWTGTGGIPIGGFLARLMYSIVLGDGSLLVSPEIRPVSRLLMHRNVVERASRVYPFLTFDQDPYVVILNGRILWVLDGFTTSDMLPYSAMMGEGERINYIRNPVKVAIDAYTGQMTAYAIDESEPILRAWRSVYPGLVRPASEVPPGLAAHFRYPQDLLEYQSIQLCAYHVTDPQTFLNNGDSWNVASQRGLSGEKEPIIPFYVEMNVPGETGSSFVQILPFTPRDRINMSGWLAAGCDPGDYGRLTLYKLAQSNPIPGPEQKEGEFSATPAIANINRQFNNEQSEIVVGNFLVVPIGSSFLYAESLFLKSKTLGLQSVPKLAKVILAFKDRVVVENTYQEALSALLGSNAAPAQPAPTQPPASTPSSVGTSKIDPTIVKQSLDLLDQADAALRSGDFARYGQLQKKAREELRGAIGR